MKLKDSLQNYVQSGVYPFHMPGHKRNPDFLPDEKLFFLDLTELEDTDDLHSPNGVLLEAMQRAAGLFRARKTYFSVGGSTVGILSAVYAASKRGGKALVARNCHRSVYHALCLCALRPIYVCPPEDELFGFCGSVTADSVRKAFETDPDISLVIITSPTYEGVISDVSAIAEVVHANGALLIVDSAHGAHLGFDSKFPLSAVTQGADIVIQSLHKTLPCFTQTALVHICTERAEFCDISSALKMFETSSPSYMLMCGIDDCVSMLKEKRKTLFSDYHRRLEKFSVSCGNLKHLRVFGCGTDKAAHCNVFARDPSKLVISARGTDINGRELYYLLKDSFKLQLEMFTADSVLAVTSICDTDEGFERLSSALIQIDGGLSDMSYEVCSPKITIPEITIPPHLAVKAEKASVPLADSEGETAACFVYAYPPGIPILAPGEKITREIIDAVLALGASGVNVQGLEAVENGKINVVKAKKLI